MSSRPGRFRSTLLALLMATAISPIASCAPSGPAASTGGSSGADATGQKRARIAAETWDREALADAQPCLLALSDGEDGRLRAADLNGTIVADNLWKPPAGTNALLFDADATGPRIAVSVGQIASTTPRELRDRVLVLANDGTVSTGSPPTSAFPLASAAVFLQDGDLLWLRRRETETSIETTMGLTDGRTGKISPVVLGGTWPKHRFIASLVALRARTAVAVVLKTDGTPAPHDDFAVVLADYENGRLVARSAPYRDDSLFTLGPGADAGTLVYARADSEESTVADEMIELQPSDTTWVPRVLTRTASCDPGFDYQYVCGGGPHGQVLYRSATDPAASGQGARLMSIGTAHDAKPTRTKVLLDLVGNQWLWLGKSIL